MLYKVSQHYIFNINFIIIAAIFFITYDGIKQYSQPYISHQYHSIIHVIAASSSEAVSGHNTI
jgi:hypothetical protein